MATTRARPTATSGGGHGQDKKHKHLAVHRLEIVGKPDEGHVDGVEHHLHAHEDDEALRRMITPITPRANRATLRAIRSIIFVGAAYLHFVPYIPLNRLILYTDG